MRFSAGSARRTARRSCSRDRPRPTPAAAAVPRRVVVADDAPVDAADAGGLERVHPVRSSPARPPIEGSPEPTTSRSPCSTPSTIGPVARSVVSNGSPSPPRRPPWPRSRAWPPTPARAASAGSARRAARCDRATARRCPRRPRCTPGMAVARSEVAGEAVDGGRLRPAVTVRRRATAGRAAPDRRKRQADHAAPAQRLSAHCVDMSTSPVQRFHGLVERRRHRASRSRARPARPRRRRCPRGRR